MLVASDTIEGVASFQQQDGWSWKLKYAKECVTTHLPNGLAPKMDGTTGVTHAQSLLFHDAAVSRRAWGGLL